MPSRPQVVSQPTDVLVIQQADDGSLTSVAVFPSGIGPLPILPALAAVIGRDPLNNLARDLKWRRNQVLEKMQCKDVDGAQRDRLASSLVPSFLASLTLPMLPWPMVFINV
jgi:hypothetical protein